MKLLIKELVDTPGPSGHEGFVRDLVIQKIDGYAEDIEVDALGNLIARKGAQQPNGRKVMLAAHMDEIGVMITHVDENGFARFTGIGGVYARNCVGGRVRFLNGKLGVISHEKQKSSYSLPTLDKFYIDLGVNSSEAAGVQVGDVAAFERPFLDLGDRIGAKALDDRIGVAILIETLRQIKKTPHEIYFVFSVQEEIGVRGGTTAAYNIAPDLGLAVDVTTSGDTPKGEKMEVKLGGGPAIKVRDSGMISDPRVVDWLVTTAQKNKIPHQLEVLLSGSTDARAMQISRAGVPSCAISIPCRYVHSPSEVIDTNDVSDAINLLVKALQKPINLQ